MPNAKKQPSLKNPGHDNGDETTCRIITGGDQKTKSEHFAPAVLKVFKKSAQEFNRIFAENKQIDQNGHNQT